MSVRDWNLSQVHAERVMNAIMQGEWTPSQIAGLLMGLKIKGESVSEVTGFVQAMRKKALKLDIAGRTVDTCGTGGDGHHTFNISTAAAFVAAAAGVPIAKHGNRSVSSKCGSADVLQELGVKIDMTPVDAQTCLKELGMAFLFAPVYHASMKHAVTPRRELGVRTVFNMLGPMSNPAMARRQVVGTFNRDAADKIARVLQNTGSEHVMVVHSADGMDEIAISAETYVNEYKNGRLESYTITPEQFGIERAPLKTIKGGTAVDNARIMQSIFKGENSPFADITILNAGAAVYVAGQVSSFSKGVEQARDVIKSGRARDMLDRMIEYSHSISKN
ncbi:MAG: anthranilate phosphoribosyltransferase [candidate division KSB1 bacterium]|nr:anthranilate phosphoribosyltransferase [candidate division KSB1 bacterium]